MLLLYREHSHGNICKMRHTHGEFTTDRQSEPWSENQHDTLQNQTDVLRFFFFNSPRHSGSDVGNKYVILLHKSHQAGSGRERRVRENLCGLFLPRLEELVPFEEVCLCPPLTVKIPDSPDREKGCRSGCDIRLLKSTHPLWTWDRPVI